MAPSINWGTKVITIPQSDLTLISGTLWELDTNQFRLDLKSLEDSEEGMVFPDTHRHNTEVTVAGVTYARTFEIINGYQVEFEDLGHPGYTVRLVGSNNNIFEQGIVITNHNSILGQNSAGLIVYSTGSGLSPGQAQQLTDIDNRTAYQIKIIDNRRLLVKEASVWHLKVFDDNGTTVIQDKELKDLTGADIDDIAAGVLAQELANSV